MVNQWSVAITEIRPLVVIDAGRYGARPYISGSVGRDTAPAFLWVNHKSKRLRPHVMEFNRESVAPGIY